MKVQLLAPVAAAILLVGCDKESTLHSRLPERQANLVMAALLDAGIDCHKTPGDEGTWNVSVVESRFADAVNLLEGNPRVIDTAGEYTLETGIRLTAVTGDHDDAQGAKRGKTLHFLLEAEGLRVAHLGDLGCALTEENARILKHPDILMIPVGGFYTIGAALARETADRLEAGTILPMHYRTKFNADWPISGPEDFLALFGKEEIRRDGEALRITRGDRECQPKVFLFKQEG